MPSQPLFPVKIPDWLSQTGAPCPSHVLLLPLQRYESTVREMFGKTLEQLAATGGLDPREIRAIFSGRVPVLSDRSTMASAIKYLKDSLVPRPTSSDDEEESLNVGDPETDEIEEKIHSAVNAVHQKPELKPLPIEESGLSRQRVKEKLKKETTLEEPFSSDTKPADTAPMNDDLSTKLAKLSGQVKNLSDSVQGLLDAEGTEKIESFFASEIAKVSRRLATTEDLVAAGAKTFERDFKRLQDWTKEQITMRIMEATPKESESVSSPTQPIAADQIGVPRDLLINLISHYEQHKRYHADYHNVLNRDRRAEKTHYARMQYSSDAVHNALRDLMVFTRYVLNLAPDKEVSFIEHKVTIDIKQAPEIPEDEQPAVMDGSVS